MCYQSQPKTRIPLEERFWASVKKGDGCWEWTGSPKGPGRNRYGVLTIPTGDCKVKRYITTHRFSWQLHFGPIPKGMQVCHKCDNPPCVRPEHLFLGTNRDNQIDCYAKKRRAAPDNRGERHGMSKLTAANVMEMRSLYVAGNRIPNIAERFGIAVSTAYSVISGARWQHLPHEQG